MSSLPKISIVIPSLNKVEYIEETLESVFSQDYPNLEVIVQDGGSTDGTLEIIKKYAKRYPKILKWQSKKDKGQTDAINKGLKKAKGEILGFLNADDVYEKEALSLVGECFAKNPQASWVGGKGRLINHKGEESLRLISYYKNILLGANSYVMLLVTNYLMQPSVFFRKEIYQQLGPIVGTERFVMEYDFWLRIAQREMPHEIEDVLSAFRITQGSKSINLTREILKIDYRIVATYTKNPLILFLHALHNLGRLVISTVLS